LCVLRTFVLLRRLEFDVYWIPKFSTLHRKASLHCSFSILSSPFRADFQREVRLLSFDSLPVLFLLILPDGVERHCMIWSFEFVTSRSQSFLRTPPHVLLPKSIISCLVSYVVLVIVYLCARLLLFLRTRIHRTCICSIKQSNSLAWAQLHSSSVFDDTISYCSR
jgi:hypothetical protein